ncbi:MAG: ABC transporter ATP-binding protein/permease [Endomicrobium sp.]|jgi:subfamily B ATP-binding cassette protein MsbA|uniref:ABC transporter ATP-binding protein n=1 Tax=Candidatus Endomicrobiellum cubanum TaxID=3242325 RepID=UPI0028332061|nr:ABC transporter ATP-binding protein/permease [Endomicrobium sp.]
MNIFSKLKQKIVSNLNPDLIIKIKRLWMEYVLPQWKLLALSMIFMGAYAGANVWSVSLLKPVFDKVFIEQNRNILFTIALEVLIAFGAKCFAQYFQNITMIMLGANFTKRLQGDLYEKFIAQDLEFFHKNNSASLIVYFTQDLNVIRDVILNCVTTLVRDACSVVGLIVLMFWKSFDMAAAMFILFPIGFYPMVYFGKKIKKIFSNQQISFGSLYAILAQAFQGIKIVKSYNLEAMESQKVRSSAEAIANIEVKLSKNNHVLSPLMEFLGGVAAACTLAYGGYRIIHGTLTTGDFVVFLVAIVAAYQPMKSLANLNARFQMGIAAINRVFSIMDKRPVIVNKSDAKVFEVRKGVIKVNNVKFDYAQGVEVLHGINLEVNEGERIAVVGAAGSGKSTLINLILRFYDVKEGSIKIDGQDIRDVTIESLRDNIAFVSQDVVLFDDTIKKNILMGKPDATDEEAINAAKQAAAHNFIINQNQGYDTVVGERGSNLSGGQKQMISIARAMLKNAPILLLDEATSSLDSKSERMVQEGLKRLMKGRTSIVIAHRLSTIINSDKIYVFESGNILESGTHAQLLALNSYYANLYKIQFMQD